MINKEKAIILTLDAYDKLDAKTAHGLIRGTDRKSTRLNSSHITIS